MDTTTQKTERKNHFFTYQTFVHNSTKITDYFYYLEYDIREYFFSQFLKSNNEFLELGLNSNLHSKTKDEYLEWKI